MVSGRADFGLMFRNVRVKPGLFRISDVVYDQEIVAGHYVNEATKQSSKLSFEALSIFAPSLMFFLEYLSAFFFASLFAGLLGWCLRRNVWRFPVRLFYNLLSPENPAFAKRSAVGMLFISIVFFAFLVRQMICNNIRTEVRTCRAQDPICGFKSNGPA